MTAPTTSDPVDNLEWIARESAKMAGVPTLPPSRDKKRQRNIKVEDQLWSKAEAKAAAQGKSTAEYIRALIDRDTQGD